MNEISFTKMHGLGNDFIIIDAIAQPVSLTKKQIQFLADRNFGIGFDQLLLIKQSQSPSADFLYQIFNADGGEADHCGNGARCLGKFIFDRDLTKKLEITVETKNRKIRIKRNPDSLISVDMGAPTFSPSELGFKAPEQLVTYHRNLELKNKPALQILFSAISMGNPHAIVLVESIDTEEVEGVGKALSEHPDFTRQVNVGFLQPISKTAASLRVFERGVGETLACGTGACAAMVAGRVLGIFQEEVVLQLNGGPLKIKWKGTSQAAKDSVVMTGDATEVFNGSFDIVNFQKDLET
jgi:diaminopimelate epimerase